MTAAHMGLAPQKRARRTKAQIAGVETAIYEVLAADHPQTLRGLFYRLTSAGVIPKTEAAYKTIVGRLAVRMRRAGVLPYDWLADSTRWQRKPTTHSSLRAALERTAQTYRRAVWAELPVAVEVWLEKDALAGVLYDETGAWDVPLMVTRGYSSLTFLYEAAQAMRAAGKTTHVYYLGDHDPSGVNIPVSVEKDLRQLSGGAAIHFTRLAVTPEQIARWSLPTRPTKTTDSRAKTFMGRSIEVDAIPARALRQLVRDAIASHVPAGYLDTLRTAEASERSLLTAIAGHDWHGGAA